MANLDRNSLLEEKHKAAQKKMSDALRGNLQCLFCLSVLFFVDVLDVSYF